MTPSVLITGASSGLGRALALEYAGPGVRLALSGRDPNRLEATAEACRGRGAAVDAKIVDIREAGAMEDWVHAADAACPLTLVIANAGITGGLGPGRTTETLAAIRKLVEVNLMGVFHTVTPALALMRPRGAGHVALMGSIGGVRGLPYSPTYSAVKAALATYADGLRGSLRGTGLCVTTIMPGFVETPLDDSIAGPKPLRMDAARAARRIRRGLGRGRRRIAFPLPVYAGACLLSALPGAWSDALLARFVVDVPAPAPVVDASDPQDRPHGAPAASSSSDGARALRSSSSDREGASPDGARRRA